MKENREYKSDVFSMLMENKANALEVKHDLFGRKRIMIPTPQDEVRKMTHLDYTWEKREKLIRKEEYEDGRTAGRSEGMSEGKSIGRSEGSRVKLISQIIKKIQRGKDILSIADAVEEPVEVIRPIYEAVVAAPGADAEQIYAKMYLK